MIKIIGLGPGGDDALTLGAINALKDSDKVFIRTEKHPVIEYIKNIGIKFSTCDSYYEKYQSFEEVYNHIAEDIIKEAEKCDNIAYAVPGHPMVAEKAVEIIIKLCKEKNIDYKVYPAVSFVDSIIERLNIDAVNGLKIIDAFDIKNITIEKNMNTIITQVYDKFIASTVKLKLLEYFDGNREIYFIRAAGIDGIENIRKIKLHELDRQDDIDYLTSVMIPRNAEGKSTFDDLVKIMQILRAENGCPWDREQTHKSLKPCVIEESYEVLEAIDEDDDSKLTEELGDLLLQVVFHAQLGKEDGYFDINDVTDGICKKMIERHPHIFGNVDAKTSEEVLDNWDKIKRKEQGLMTYTDELKHIPKNLPALMRAYKVQKKASKVGFDFNNIEDVQKKIIEELNEVKDVYNCKNRARIEEEIGDLIFSCINFARFLDIEPEIALNCTIDKFISRFEYIEKASIKENKDLRSMTLEEMDILWEKSKKKN